MTRQPDSPEPPCGYECPWTANGHPEQAGHDYEPIAARSAIPAAEGLDVERLYHAKRNIERRNDRAFSWDRDGDLLAAEYARLRSKEPTDAR